MVIPGGISASTSHGGSAASDRGCGRAHEEVRARPGDNLGGRAARPTHGTQTAPRTGRGAARCRGGPGRAAVATRDDLAARHEGCARRPLRRDPAPRGRRADLGQQPPPCPARKLGWWASGARNGERKYHLSNLPLTRRCARSPRAIKARWVCEQAHQQLKQELGLGYFEGRSWTGLHRHALMACIAFAYLQHLRLKAVHRRGKRRQPLTAGGPPPQPSLPAVRRAVMARLFARLAGQVRCPHCYREMTDGARP